MSEFENTAAEEADLARRATSGSTNPVPALLLLCGVFLLHVYYLACVAEDTHITFRFARHFAEGHGFVWNLGEPPIEGFTTFLWVLVAAAALATGIDVFWLTQALGTLAALGTLVLTFVVARRFMGASDWIALVPCLFLAVSGPLATWAGSGMEMTTFGFFVLLGVYAYLAHLRQPSQRWLLASGASLLVATLLRPEGGLVMLVLGLLAISVYWPRTRPTFRQHLVWGVVYSVPFLLFLAWRVHVFGDWVPNTFYQKTGGGFWQHARGAGYLIFFAFFYLQPLVPFPALLAWEVGLPEGRRLLRLETWTRLANAHEAVTLCLTLSLTYFAYIVYAGGDYMAMYRFMVPVLPFLYLLLVPVLDPIRRATADSRHKTGLLVLVVAVAAGATGIHSTPIEESFFRKATWQHGNYRGVMIERRYVARFGVIGRFFEGYGKRGESLATRSIGAIGYYARDLAIHDLSGLVDRHIARIPVVASPRGWAGHEKWDLDYSFERLPTYFMLDESLAAEDVPAASRESALAIAEAIEARFPYAQRFADWIRAHPDFIEAHYRLQTAWLDDEVNGESGYLAFLERKDASGT